MTLPDTVAVLGLGLMGGSLARELAARGVGVRGYDPDPGSLQAAVAAGVLRGALPESLEGIEAADLLVVAAPVSAAGRLLEAARPRLRAGCVITDLGSTKRSIEAEAERLGLGERFVGSHPLTGDHRSGWAASRRGLFVGARVFLCPTPATRPDALARVRALWTAVGAIPETVEAEAHDRQLAWTSHLPQIGSTALALALAAAGRARGELGPGGRDMTRLAGSSPEMWSAICAENADLLDEAVRALEAQLAEFRTALRSGDPEEVRRLFSRAQRWSREEDG